MPGIARFTRAEARTAGGGVFVREAVVELIGDPDQPFLTYAWQQPFSLFTTSFQFSD